MPSETAAAILFAKPMHVGSLDEKPGLESQAKHQNKIQKLFLWQFPLSRFLAKTLRVN